MFTTEEKIWWIAFIFVLCVILSAICWNVVTTIVWMISGILLSIGILRAGKFDGER